MLEIFLIAFVLVIVVYSVILALGVATTIFIFFIKIFVATVIVASFAYALSYVVYCYRKITNSNKDEDQNPK